MEIRVQVATLPAKLWTRVVLAAAPVIGIDRATRLAEAGARRLLWLRVGDGRWQRVPPPGPGPQLLVHRLRPDAVLPRYLTAGAAGMDISAAIDRPVWMVPGERAAIPTGLAIAIPDGYEGQLRPRSGLAREHGVTIANAPGTIDADFRGELVVVLVNHGARDVQIEPGQRVAQLVIAPVARASVLEVDGLPATARGAGGFGSTGK